MRSALRLIVNLLDRARIGAARARGFGCLLILSSTVVAPEAVAHVLEISDDGDVTVFDSSVGSTVILPATVEEVAEPLAGDAYAEAARRHGLDPGLLRAVAWNESRGRNSAVSRKGAIGIMQLMPKTAAELGVDPHDPLANINGGAAYLAQQLVKFRTIPLALAAYNAGPGAVSRYGGVPPFLETRRYVNSVLRQWSGSSSAGFASNPGPPPPTFTKTLTPQLSVMLIEVPDE